MINLGSVRRAVATICFASILVVPVSAAAGLDPTFGNMGVVTTDFPGSDSAYGMAILRKLRIIVVGTTSKPSGDLDFAVASYDQKGKLYQLFGNGGKVITKVGPGDDVAEAVAIQGNNRIIVAGWSNMGNKHVMSVVCYKPDGSIDTSFGNAGKKLIAIGTSAAAYALAIQDDGKIVVVGGATTGTDQYAVVRLTAKGGYDTTFGNGGIVTTAIAPGGDGALAVAIQPDQKIVVGGRSGDAGANKFAYSMVRYQPNGKPDPNFGKSGVVLTAYGDYGTRLRSIGFQHGGKIVLGGVGKGDAQKKVATMMRFTSSGKPDMSFGTQGIVNTTTTSSAITPVPMAITASDKIVLASFSFPKDTSFGITGYTANGIQLSSLATNGNIGTFGDMAQAMAIQPDGKVLVAGWANFGAAGTSSDFAVVRYNVNW